MRLGAKVVVAASAALLAGCAQPPMKPSEAHIRAEEAAPAGAVPPPVQLVPAPPKPKPALPPETYSVVVNNVRVQDLLFALARDAKVDVDIHPGVSGTVTLNAIEQTLPQLLARIARQVDMRYEFDGKTIVIMPDTPYLRAYKVDYLSAARNVKMQSTASTQFGAAGGAAGAASPTGTGATATVDVSSENKLWDSLVNNVKELLRETDKVIPVAPARPSAPATPAPGAPGGAQPPAAAQPPAPAAPAAEPSVTYVEAASVIANRESGVLYVRATAKQHERVQEFLDQVMAGAKRQVLIEATVAEVQLNNQYQRGIDWSRLRTGPAGFQIQQVFGTPALPGAQATQSSFIVGYATPGLNFISAINLLETFGTVRVLSSPKLGVLNNQTALLRVTRDIVYFTITPSTTPLTIAGGSGNLAIQQAFTTTPQVAAEGFMMAVLPQISDADSVVLSVRPTIRRQVDFATDPNPALVDPARQNRIPVFETREFDSILRVQSGQIAVLGGLMQDTTRNLEEMIPGVRDVPLLGELLEQRRDLNQKTELVIFLRATVIRDPSLEGDYRSLRGLLPGEDFLSRPNPGRVAPSVGPSVEPPR